MLKKLLSVGLLLAAFLWCHCQDAETIVSDLKTTASNVALNMGSEDKCNIALRQIENIQEQIDGLMKDEDITSDDKKLLNWAKSHSKALDVFIRSVGNSGYMANYLKESELSLVKDLFEVDFAEVFKEKNFCCKLYECKMGSYTCLLAFKSGSSEIYTIKATLLVKNGSSTTTMGLSTNRYRRIWYATVPTIYKVTFISCEYKGPSTFDF